MSDLERAQEWLGCERAIPGYGAPFCDGHSYEVGPGWPCPEAVRLAALLAETRADEDARWRAQWEGKWTAPTSPDEYECCASGSCEVCRR